ncbi:MAG: TonB-dependent receptor, partial [Bacteroidia bacterium]
SAQSGIFIKSYGTGGISTPSFRGTGPGHTAVIWNGFNLQSPMHGGVDFSILPVSMTDQICISPGGSAALFGSGAVGGLISLSSFPSYFSGLKMNLSGQIAPFGPNTLSLNFQQGTISSFSRISVFHQQATNDYRYFSRAGDPATWDHGAFRRSGLTASQSFRLNDRQQLHFHLWYLGASRELPVSAFQQDENLRTALIWENKGTRTYQVFRTGYFSDKILYDDTLSSVFSQSHSGVFSGEAEVRFLLSPSDVVESGVMVRYTQARADGYGADRFSQVENAVFGSYKHIFPQDFSFVASLRQGIRDRGVLPAIPAAGLEKKWGNKLLWRFHAGRNYRLPTFNDLYWRPGGNPALAPESGYSLETGINYRLPVCPVVKADFTIFHSRIKDWIAWLPGISFWHPENIHQVWNRGVESEISFDRLKFGKITTEGKLSYQWIKSTRQNRLSVLDEGVRRQLIYVPEHNFQGFVSASLSSYTFSFQHAYCGRRFTASDHSASLAPYHLGRLSAGKTFDLPNQSVSVYVQINNLWNSRYEVVAGYPMPLRHIVFRLDATLEKPLKKRNTPNP